MELSRESIEKIFNDDWLLMDDCEGNKNCDVVKELARIALLSLGTDTQAQPVIPEQAKPVAYTDNRNLKSLQKGCNTALLWLKHNAEVGDIPLYTELPAQPVSEPYKLPSRWVLVPLEPTAAMFHAFNDCDYGRKSMRERYIQMIEAAPAQEQK
ncbi:MAG: hypothetical protein E6995_13090 [Enterobacteriaceae bacterium]|uniref:hypothetical protein n=1 Tax=Hafnia paralvei TaxID=546367 RepID=UPI00241EDC46|nr:hypothetical protein [Hafnia paralvei]MDU1193070.1 hypothetical protein [Enterobacteriaceae bacterium]MDU1245160.1 hypothetical protein [Enterobacteriaceae bacterium]